MGKKSAFFCAIKRRELAAGKHLPYNKKTKNRFIRKLKRVSVTQAQKDMFQVNLREKIKWLQHEPGIPGTVGNSPIQIHRCLWSRTRLFRLSFPRTTEGVWSSSVWRMAPCRNWSQCFVTFLREALARPALFPRVAWSSSAPSHT